MTQTTFNAKLWRLLNEAADAMEFYADRATGPNADALTTIADVRRDMAKTAAQIDALVMECATEMEATETPAPTRATPIVAGMLTWAAIFALAWLVMWTVREMSR